tara:strand:- start:32536 stop:33681 length:1146 start_codon:yes stop_codon:yes gene_type:complete
MAIDFNSDIAGLKGQFFPVGGLRDSEQRRMRKNYQEVTAPLQARSMELTNNLVRLEQQELAFDRSRADMKEARRKAKQEKDALRRLPDVTSKLDTILTDPSKSSFDKARDINNLQRTMIGQITNSPQLRNLFTSALETNDIDLKEQKRQEDVEDRANQENSRKLGLAYGLAQSGNVEATKKLVEGIDEGDAYVSFAEGVRGGRISSAQRKALEDQQKRESEQRNFFVQNVDEKVNILTGYETGLEALRRRSTEMTVDAKPTTLSGAEANEQARGGEIPPPTNESGQDTIDGPPRFTQESVENMRSIYKDLVPRVTGDDDYDKKLQSMDNMELYGTLLILIRQKRRELLADRARGFPDLPPLVGPPRAAMTPSTGPISLFNT